MRNEEIRGSEGNGGKRRGGGEEERRGKPQ